MLSSTGVAKENSMEALLLQLSSSRWREGMMLPLISILLSLLIVDSTSAWAANAIAANSTLCHSWCCRYQISIPSGKILLPATIRCWCRFHLWCCCSQYHMMLPLPGLLMISNVNSAADPVLMLFCCQCRLWILSDLAPVFPFDIYLMSVASVTYVDSTNDRECCATGEGRLMCRLIERRKLE